MRSVLKLPVRTKKAKLLPNYALSVNIVDLKIPCKTFEEQNVHVAGLKTGTQRPRAKIVMDYDAFNKMSLAEQAPVSSITGIGGPAETRASSNASFQQLPSKLLKRQRYIKKKAEIRERKAILAEKERIEKKLSVLRAAHLEALDDDDDDGGVPLLPSITGPKPTAKTSGEPNEAEVTALQDGHLAVEATNQQRPTRRSRTKRKELAALCTTSMQLNPNAPSYEPLSIAPIGAASAPLHEQPNLQTPFTMYQPMHTQYSSMATLRHIHQAPTIPAPLMPIGRWSGSPPGSAPFSTASAIQRESEKVAKHKLSRRHKSHISKALPPEPTASYLAQSSQPTQKLLLPQKLLLVLDLNGTLLHRGKSGHGIYPRPNLDQFIKYCLTNHSVCIWSSARPVNVELMCSRIFDPYQRALLLAEWGRDTLGLSKGDYNEKVQVYKRLDVIWKSTNLQHRHPRYHLREKWSQANTVLIDDSMLKAVAQPHNHIEIPEYKGNGADGDTVLGQVVAYLEEARMWKDVSSFMRQEKFMIKAGWDWDWNQGRRLTPDSRQVVW